MSFWPERGDGVAGFIWLGQLSVLLGWGRKDSVPFCPVIAHNASWRNSCTSTLARWVHVPHGKVPARWIGRFVERAMPISMRVPLRASLC